MAALQRRRDNDSDLLVSFVLTAFYQTVLNKNTDPYVEDHKNSPSRDEYGRCVFPTVNPIQLSGDTESTERMIAKVSKLTLDAYSPQLASFVRLFKCI